MVHIKKILKTNKKKLQWLNEAWVDTCTVRDILLNN